MKVVVRVRAAMQVQGIHDYIPLENPMAARRIADRIYDHVERMAAVGFGNMGREGRRSGTREVSVYPYVIVYRIDPARNEIVVLSVVHGARRS